MKIVYNWLKEFVDVTLAPDGLRSRLSLAGISVDTLEDSPAGPVLDAELTTNRPDCLGHLGIAREVAAIERKRLRAAAPKLRESAERAVDVTRVEIECPDLCGRFTARVLRGVKIGPSPDWLRQRLEAIGQTPINNVVDATNYVMFELGHPLHAFDFATLMEKRIIVRRARAGEIIRTLDGIERKLTPSMCMIADAKRAVGVGGVMGGAATEISSATRDILIECAWFDPVSVRRTAKALGLRTEASTRFERGADPEMAELASRRCAELIQQIAGGEVCAGAVDVYPARREPERIALTRREILRVMGADIPPRDVEEILAALGFAPERTDGQRGSEWRPESLMAAWECRRASWRHDVTREIDLVEEVARHYGYDKFPSRIPPARQPAARLPHAEAEDRLRERLHGLGYTDIITIPLVDEPHDALFRGADVVPARIENPLAEDAATLRSSGIVTMLHALEWNLNRGQRNVRFYEIGRRYELRGGTPLETPILTLGSTGLAREKSVHDEAREFDFAELKGDLEALGEILGGLTWTADAPAWLAAGQSADVGLAGKALGAAGRLARGVAEKFKLRQDVFIAELDLEPMYAAYEAARATLRYQQVPRFHAVERDFSLIVDDKLTFGEIAAAIRGLNIAGLMRIAPVDLFRGGTIPKGKHSLLVRVEFQSHTATLTEAQLTDFSSRIITALESLGATLRSA